jgi:group I intron endonuclease
MIIYKTTNLINGKFYIGKDKHNDPKYFGSGKILKQAIKKYGIDNFIKEIIEECYSEQQWLEREIYWIDYYNAINEGYNIALGGNGGDTISNNPNKMVIYEKKKVTDDNKSEIDKLNRNQKISDSLKETWVKKRIDNPESIVERNKKISQTQKGIPKPIEQIEKQKKTKQLNGTSQGEKNSMFGKSHKEETKKLLSELKLGKKRNKKSIEKQKESIKNREFIMCPYCGLTAKKSPNMIRYHFNNCKLKTYE